MNIREYLVAQSRSGKGYVAHCARMLLRYKGESPSTIARAIEKTPALTGSQKRDLQKWLRDIADMKARRIMPPSTIDRSDWDFMYADRYMLMRRNHIARVDVG